MEKIHFMAPLTGNATKTFTFKKGKWEKTSSYKAGKWLNPYVIEAKNLKEAYELFEKAQDHPCFMIHGQFKEGINLEEPIVRRMRLNPLDNHPITIENREISLMCFDIDHWKIKKGQTGEEAVEEFLKELPSAFQNADYIRQFSSSYGLFPEKLKCHLFFWLQEKVSNEAIREWVLLFNKNKKIKLIDPSLLVGLQPIYIQQRICIGEEDPVKNFWSFLQKSGKLKYNFHIEATPDQRKKAPDPKKMAYDVAEGVQQIINSEDFHNEINRLALSLLNKRLPPKTVKQMLEGAMNAAKNGLSDPERLADWQTRFDDIDRSVDSAAVIVDNPTIEELEDWVNESNRQEIRLNFAKRAFKLNPLDLKSFVDSIELKLGVGVKNIKDSIKIAKNEEEQKKELVRKAKKTEWRKRKGIHEVLVTLSNTETVCEEVSQVLANSTNGDCVFKAPAGLVKVGQSWPKTIRQVMKKHALGEDFPKMPVIQYFKSCSLGARIEKDIAFLNSNAKEIPCPTNVLKIIEEGTDKNFRPLSGIIEHPFVNTEFEIVQKNGYDKQTGLYTTLHRKLNLTLIEPKAAYDYLAHTVFDEFPFGSELDRCVAVSALMTCVQRPVIAGDSGFPGFAIVSPTQSSGKTTLAQLISYSIYNRAMPATNFTKDDNELSKHLLAILKEGHSCVLFDNMPAGTEVTSNVLAKAMSSDTLSGRLLGDTKTIEVPSAVIWMFTGNSIYLLGDFATRVYPININPEMENPDSRHFKRKDIGQWAIEHRKKTMSAIISLILTAKKKTKMSGASRFPAWDKFVRQPLFQITGIDINEAVNINKKNDSYLQATTMFLEILKKKYLTNEFKAKDIMTEAFGGFDSAPSDLGDILLEILDKRASNTRSVGRLLGRLNNVILNGLRLRKSELKYIPTRWRIEEVKELS